MKFWKKQAVIIFAGLFPAAASAQVTWFLSKKQSSHKWAVVPSYKRTGSLGHVLGGRVFVYPAGRTGLYLSASADWKPQREHFMSYKSNLFYWTSSQSEFHVQLEYDSSFDAFYEKDSVNRREAPSRSIRFKSRYLAPWRKDIFIGGVLDGMFRRELEQPCFFVKRLNGKLSTEQISKGCGGPPERAGSLGFSFRQDTRDKKFNPSQGYFVQGSFKAGRDFLEKFYFFQTEIKTRYIVQFFSKWVFQLSGGWTKSKSSVPYSYQFQLGGLSGLRGYRQGRFRSGKYYLAQMEWRPSWKKWLEPLAFLDLGSIEFEKRPKFSFGLGVRVGLPPSYDHKIRLEMGWGEDQSNFIAAFALPY